MRRARPVRKTVALGQWEREVRRSQRTPNTLDALWRAACAEREAIEWDALGFPAFAASCRARAQAIIQDAAK